ncbi:hypothetical protein BH11ACT8_BH11ACT8_21720 [soil metagenome]
MSDFEDRLGRALSEGAEEAPGAGGLADGARARARTRRTRRVSAFAVAAVLVLVVPLAVVAQRDDDGNGGVDGAATSAGAGWKTVSFERETYVRDQGDVTVLVDVPESWTEIPDSDDACGFYDYGAPADSCTEVELMSVISDAGNLDYYFGAGLRPASDFDFHVDAAWTGHVDLGGVDVGVASNDEQTALRVLGSARLVGQEIPDLAGDWPVIVDDGVAYQAPPLDEAAGFGVQVGPRTKRDEYAEGAEVTAGHWQASATVGDHRIQVLAPTQALAELVAGSARVAEDGEWQTVRYDGSPTNESGDASVLVDLPGDWGLLDTSGCSFTQVRYGPDGDDPCDSSLRAGIESNALYDTIAPPGLGPDATSGDAFAGGTVVFVDAADHETARRILASVRLVGADAPSPTWRTDEVGQGTLVDVPGDDSVDVTFALVSRVDESDPANDRTPAAPGPGGRWVALARPTPGTLVTVSAPTQALADVVASSVRRG